ETPRAPAVASARQRTEDAARCALARLHALARRIWRRGTRRGVVAEEQAPLTRALPHHQAHGVPHDRPAVRRCEHGCRQRPTPHAASWTPRAAPQRLSMV